jgi:ribosome recycling factor
MKNIKLSPNFEPAVSHLVEQLRGIRTGRASTGLVEGVTVDYYGTQTRLKDIASITTPGAQLIQIEPWDKNAVSNVVKAIEISSLGLNPTVAGSIIRLNLPQLTEERRKELVKVVGKYVEEAKIAVRNVREKLLREIKNQLDAKELSEDEHRGEKETIQKEVNDALQVIDEEGKEKENELLTV